MLYLEKRVLMLLLGSMFLFGHHGMRTANAEELHKTKIVNRQDTAEKEPFDGDDDGVTGEHYTHEQDPVASNKLTSNNANSQARDASGAWCAGNDMQRRFLAVDRSLHAKLENMQLHMGQARHKKKIWEEFAEPWEKKHALRLGYISSVIKDHNGRYRLYYEVLLGNAERVTAVAISKDGIHWIKPKLNIAKNIVDDPASNLISVEAGDDLPGQGLLEGKWFRGGCVFYDPQASDKAHRYKLMWRQGNDMYVATSADGLHFRTQGQAVKYTADTMASCFRDELRDEYVIYGRHWFDRAGRETIQQRLGADGRPPVRRGVVLHRAKRWEETPWSPASKIVIDPMDIFEDGGWTDFYTPGVSIYHGQYIGVPATYFRRPNADLTKTIGPIYPIFMHSHDGLHWAVPDKTHPIIALARRETGARNRSDIGQIFPSATLVERNGELLVYYWLRPVQHHKTSTARASYHVASLRVDGFGSLRARGPQVGYWLTPPLRVPMAAKSFCVNATVRGTLRVEVLDAETGEVLTDLSAEDCMPFTGNRVRGRIRWKSGGISRVAGQMVRIRMILTDGDIFSFWFE